MRKKRCSVEGCDRPYSAKGFCKLHHSRWTRHGDPLVVKKIRGRICSIPGCGKPTNARGLCYMHYDRWRFHGDPLAVNQIRGDDLSRFWSRVEKTPTCWIWTGSTFSAGAGQFYSQGKNWLAHRWLWTQERGPIPDGRLLCHVCDNPPCVRLDHLYVGSHRNNMDDRVERKTGGRGERHGAVKRMQVQLTPELAQEIQARYNAGGISQATLGNEYGIHQGTVSRIVRGEHWLC